MKDYVCLREHFKRMSRFLFWGANSCDSDRVVGDNIPDAIYWGAVAEPLRIAGSIQEIQTETDILDDPRWSLYIPGMEVWRDPVSAQQVMQELTPHYVLETTRFSLAWSAYESLAEIVAPSSSCRSQGGKTKSIISFLQKYPDTFPVIELFETFQRTRILLNQISSTAVKEADECAKRWNTEQYAYIQLCRIVRNELFHSPEFSFSDLPLEEDFIDDPQEYVEIAVWGEITRLLLLTMQSVLFVYFKEAKCELDWSYLGREDGGLVPIQDALCELHLGEEFGQLSLPLGFPSNFVPRFVE